MFNTSTNKNQSMLLTSSPPLIGKRRGEFEHDEMNNDISLETSQLMIRSPIVDSNNNKRPRYEPSWTLDNLCTHPCSPLAAIDLEVVF
jgi:hypothetical protein